MKKMTATALSLSAVMGVTAAIGGGTYALFNDTENAVDQTLTAGTLDLEFGGPAETTDFDIKDVAPGDPASSTRLTISNTGSIGGNALFKLTGTSTENGCADAEKKSETNCEANDLGELADALRVSVAEVTVVDGEEVLTPISLGNSPAFLGGQKTFTVALPGKQALRSATTKTLQFSFELPGEAGNNVQTDKAVAAIEATLNQG